MSTKEKIEFIKNYIKDTHCDQDFKDLLTFSKKEINRIYKEILTREKKINKKKIKIIGRDSKIDTVLLNGVKYRGYKIGDVPRLFKEDRAITWFNYKGY